VSQTTDEGRGFAALHPAHVVACYTCKAPFDAISANWCQCLATRRSLVCPGCQKCFCQSPQVYKQGFWERAPQLLWDRVAAEHRSGEDLPENPAAELVEHPLVLIVDDEKEIRRVAFAAITGLGYRAVVASDGEEGIELAARYRPDLILTDAFMPKLDGREMCRRIKANPELATAKIVIITSVYTASRYKYEAYKEFQADDYLSKPLELSSLSDILRKYLGEPAGAEREPAEP
jgi:CheY-like chemotaxis protein